MIPPENLHCWNGLRVLSNFTLCRESVGVSQQKISPSEFLDHCSLSCKIHMEHIFLTWIHRTHHEWKSKYVVELTDTSLPPLIWFWQKVPHILDSTCRTCQISSALWLVISWGIHDPQCQTLLASFLILHMISVGLELISSFSWSVQHY